MKLLEFFGIINELQTNVYSRGGGSIKGFYGTRNAQIPTLILLSTDGSDLKYADDVYALRLQPNSLRKVKRDLSMKQYRGQELTDVEQMNIAIINLFQNLRLDGDLVRKIGDSFPAKIIELNGRPRIFKYMTTDVGMPEGAYTNTFGEKPEMDEGDFIQFHNARLIVPDTMRPASVKIATEVLETVYQHLDDAGETDVFGGDIRFTKMPATTGGTYSLTYKTIMINQTIKQGDSMNTVATLLHEYGHKKMYELMTKDAIADIKYKFRERRKDGESYHEDIDYATAVHHALSQFQVGQELHYIGRKRAYKRNPDYVITAIASDMSRASLAHADAPDRVVSDYPMVNLLNPKKWEADGIDFTKPQPKPKYKIKTDEWFPTKYSESSYEEWWAELYAVYTFGNLSGEPAQWMRSMLHGNTTETVGGNAGEINREDDQPVPPPAHGDEEGNAGWEWTDPYHGSGAENAVMSRTP